MEIQVSSENQEDKMSTQKNDNVSKSKDQKDTEDKFSNRKDTKDKMSNQKDTEDKFSNRKDNEDKMSNRKDTKDKMSNKKDDEDKMSDRKNDEDKMSNQKDDEDNMSTKNDSVSKDQKDKMKDTCEEDSKLDKKLVLTNVSMFVKGELIINDFESVTMDLDDDLPGSTKGDPVMERMLSADSPSPDDPQPGATKELKCFMIAIYGTESSTVYPILYRKYPELPSPLYIVSFSDKKVSASDLKEKTLAQIQDQDFFGLNTFIPNVSLDEKGSLVIKNVFDAAADHYEELHILHILVDEEEFGDFCLNQIELDKFSQYNGFNRIFVLNDMGIMQTEFKGDIFWPDKLSPLPLIRSMMVVRLSNKVFERMWNKDSISAVLISLKLKSFDVNSDRFTEMLSHLIKLLACIILEPKSNIWKTGMAEEQTEALKSIRTPESKDIVSGKVDDAISFIMVNLKSSLESWQDVPLIIQLGFGMDSDNEKIQILLRPTDVMLAAEVPNATNELVLNLRPNPKYVWKLFVQSALWGDDEEPPKVEKLSDVFYTEFTDDFVESDNDFIADHLVNFMEPEKKPFVDNGYTSEDIKEMERIIRPTRDIKEEDLEPYAGGSQGPSKALDLLVDLNLIKAKTSY